MQLNAESAILDELRKRPTGLPIAGGQLAEALQLSEQTVLDTATAMGELPPKYDDGLVIVATATEEFTGEPTVFYVSFQPFDAESARS